ncbi:molecular chaperone HtpG [Parasutterella muris]|uniref:Chaperone protein HtpG n=1 Tax=Parasutterella muris TaxID=2565572 RepID=A0A6L6YIX1_9BURK|nr:molecular chaperone HtpG [Parasutterella muris]MVX56673.1 molecular chaperone HtpG [Parasutterella muris]
MSENKKETLGFQTEVKQMLHLMVHSLYSNREIFLRELVSNASDAIDKLRFAALDNPALLKQDPHPSIRIGVDEQKQLITISDDGIGMTRSEVIEHLGTIAKSGTKEFFAHLSGDQQKDAQLIGQFGVGFYSAFIVADKVTVITRKAGDPADAATMWESSGEGEFTVENTTRDHFGTDVILSIKSEDRDLVSKYRIRNILQKYSDHISTPILMGKDEYKEDKLIETGEWEAVNQGSAIWARPKSEITEDQYKEFFHHLSHDSSDPLCWTHNKVEGRNEYIQLLYVPSTVPYDLWDRESVHGLKLYVKRVFIMDDSSKLLPRYLRFIRGVIDSEDLPLNVSREILQQTRDLRVIRDGTTKRVLSMLEDLAANRAADYDKFWAMFGNVLKEGLGEDPSNKDRIAKLLRFVSTSSEGKPSVTLEGYISRMKTGQNSVYYVTGETTEAAAKSPLLELFRKKDIEVLLLSGPIDEWMTQFMTEFDGKQLVNIAKGDLDLGELSDAEEKEEKAKVQTEYQPLVERFKESLGDEVEDVRMTLRLTDSPACIVTDPNALNPAFVRMMRAAGQDVPDPKPILELNPNNPLVSRLKESGAFSGEWAKLLLEQAQLMAGEQLKDPAGFVKRMNQMLLDTAKDGTTIN